MKKSNYISIIAAMLCIMCYATSCDSNNQNNATTTTTSDISTTEAETETVVETTTSLKRERLSIDITNVYDEDIKSLLGCTFTINQGEQAPLVRFDMADGGVYTCQLAAIRNDKELKKTWHYADRFGTSTYYSGDTTFWRGSDATYYNYPYGMYIVRYDPIFTATRINRITFEGYENILE